MEFWTSVRVVARRWYVVAASLVAFAVVGSMLVQSVEARYEAAGSVVLLQQAPTAPAADDGDESIGALNPFQTADFQANQFALIMVEVLTSDPMMDELERAGVGRDYSINKSTNQTPILFLTVKGTSPARAMDAYRTLLAQLRAELRHQQAAVRAPEGTHYTAVDLSLPTTPEAQIGSRIQAGLFIGIIAIVVSIGLALLTESLATGRFRPVPVPAPEATEPDAGDGAPSWRSWAPSGAPDDGGIVLGEPTGSSAGGDVSVGAAGPASPVARRSGGDQGAGGAAGTGSRAVDAGEIDNGGADRGDGWGERARGLSTTSMTTMPVEPGARGAGGGGGDPAAPGPPVVLDIAAARDPLAPGLAHRYLPLVPLSRHTGVAVVTVAALLIVMVVVLARSVTAGVVESRLSTERALATPPGAASGATTSEDAPDAPAAEAPEAGGDAPVTPGAAPADAADGIGGDRPEPAPGATPASTPTTTVAGTRTPAGGGSPGRPASSAPATASPGGPVVTVVPAPKIRFKLSTDQVTTPYQRSEAPVLRWTVEAVPGATVKVTGPLGAVLGTAAQSQGLEICLTMPSEGLCSLERGPNVLRIEVRVDGTLIGERELVLQVR